MKNWRQLTPLDLADDSFIDYLEWVILDSIERPYQFARSEEPDNIEGLVAEMTRRVLSDLSLEYPDRARAIAAAEDTIVNRVIQRIGVRGKN